MEENGNKGSAILRLVFNASLAGLSYELALMRVFSISLWYHFAFMVVSIAMLGIGASGTALSIFPGLKDLRRVPSYGFLLALGIPASYLCANAVPFDPARLSWDRIQLLAVSLYYVILCVPFFFFGLIVSTGYASMAREANAIYTADLLGAGAGAIAMTWLLSLGGPEASVFTVSALLATGLLMQASAKIRAAAMLLLVLDLGVLYLHPAFIQPRISPYKPYALALQFPGAERLGTAYSPYTRVDLFKSPAVRFAPGLSFTYLDPLPLQTGIAVDAGELYAMTEVTDQARLSFLGSLPSSLAYRLGRNQDVLVIEPKAGLAVLMAEQFGAGTVDAIDSNPLVISTVRDYGSARGSPLYDENTRTGLARTWLLATGRQFDLIDLSLMGSWPSAAFGFAEDYRFTIEAFGQYLSHLKSDGLLSMNLYIIPPPRTELRLLATLIASAEAAGIRDIEQHVAAIRSWDTLTLVVKRSALTAEDVGRIRNFAGAMRFDLVYVPGIRPEESNVHIKMPGNEYAEAFKSLMSKDGRERFMARYLFDIAPVSDERPFFHYYLKLGNLKATYRVMGEKWQYFVEEGYLLPLLFAQVLAVSAALVLLPLLLRTKKEDAPTAPNPFRILSYFALLGTAYLFVEIAFIQKMILGLENPSSAASTVISSVLIGSGLGSLISGRIKVLKNPFILPVLSGLVFVYSFLLPGTVAALSALPITVKVLLCFIIVMPAGVLMGVPFPLGMSLLGSIAPGLIPWAWAMNGCFSVLAPVLAIMLALSAGFQVVLLFGAAMYLLAFWAIAGWGLKFRGNMDVS
jgi:hypothetical protein